MTGRRRDSQKSKVYEWERAAVRLLMGRGIGEPDFDTIEDCTAYAAPIWRTERGRVGRQNIAAPELASRHRGAAVAWDGDGWRHARGTNRRSGGLIQLPKWARSRWVILHELAHRLINDRSKDPGHGPRFVGCLIGLVARHLDLDAQRLMAMADEHGVAYHVRTVGVVPVWSPVHFVRQALHTMPPMTAMDLACELSLNHRVDITMTQVRGAALVLIRRGEARWLRGRLMPLEQPVAAADEMRMAA